MEVSIFEDQEFIVLSNMFLSLEFKKNGFFISSVRSDFNGKGEFNQNLLADSGYENSGIRLEPYNFVYNCMVVEKCEDTTRIKICSSDDSEHSLTAVWVISLSKYDRHAAISIEVKANSKCSYKNLKLCTYLNQWLATCFFEKGVVQYVNSEELIFSSKEKLKTYYTMDRNCGSISIVPIDISDAVEYNLLSGGSKYGTGLEIVFSGNNNMKDCWTKKLLDDGERAIFNKNDLFSANFHLYANNQSFPLHKYNDKLKIDVNDKIAYYIAVYGSAAASLGSYFIQGSCYPTLASPKRCYRDMHTFFDPDSWATVSVLSYSADEYLQNEARKVLELAETYMSEEGQLPHHFSGVKPEFFAISGAPQTGPNIFWIMAAFEYVNGTGDYKWLNEHMGNMKAAFNWLLNFYNSDKKLLNVNGPLWTDTFIRTGYTFDTNAMMIRLLDILSGAANFLGDHELKSIVLKLKAEMIEGIESLWSGDDHYITCMDESKSVIKDMIDTENYFAVAFGITNDTERKKAIMERLDSNQSTHPGGKGTWVSEKYYDEENCYLGNTGDSECAMARHWWADQKARSQMKMEESFFEYYNNIRMDLLENTWMTERYDLKGNMIRAPYYHEYPEILTIIMRENLYGIDIKLDKITIDPLYKKPFSFSTGSFNIYYSKDYIKIDKKIKTKVISIHGLEKNAEFFEKSIGTIYVDESGVMTINSSQHEFDIKRVIKD